MHGPQPPGEGKPRRSAPEEIQMSFATTVGRPEPNQWKGRTRQRSKAVCPSALPQNAVVGIPDF